MFVVDPDYLVDDEPPAEYPVPPLEQGVPAHVLLQWVEVLLTLRRGQLSKKKL